ncbi:MAG: DUF5317 family protein [Clostridiales bacterium]|nr:DUF5317 family protein [Clostridiales bacterium]
MLTVLFVLIAIVVRRIQKKSLGNTEFSFSFIFLIFFILLDEAKMIIFHQLPQISNFLFVYIFIQYVILALFVFHYIYKIPTMILAFGGLLNFAVMTSNNSMMPVASKIMSMSIMKVFTSWITESDVGFFVFKSKTTLWFVSDIIPVPMFNTGLLSPGDILIAIGAGLLVYSLVPKNTSDIRAKHAHKKTPEA